MRIEPIEILLLLSVGFSYFLIILIEFFLSYAHTHEAEQNILEEQVCEETLLIERVGDMPFNSKLGWHNTRLCVCVF